MTSQIEQRLMLACRAFFAEVLAIAEDAAAGSVRSVFAEARRQLGRGSTVPGPSATDERQRSRKVARVGASAPRGRPSVLPTDYAAVRERVIEGVRQHPGLTAMELIRHVSIPEAALRRYLRQLAEEHRIRIHEAPSKFPGQSRHTYFVLEAPNGAAGEALAATAFA